MYLALIIGPMFSGKTKKMIEFIRLKKREGKKSIIISHASDIRYAKMKIASHDGQLEPCISLYDLLPVLDTQVFSETDCVFIEEAQFFDDLLPFVLKCIACKKNVYVAGLQSDYMMRPFSNIISLISLADNIIHLRAKCMYDGCFQDAPFSKCIDFSGCRDDNIGGIEKYMAVCRSHFLKE